MKVISKISSDCLNEGEIYECHETPTTYDPITLHSQGRMYIVTCNDGLSRKYDKKYFIKLDDYRNDRIDEILD